MRLLLISNSGKPFLDHCRDQIASFLGSVKTTHYITAARLDDEMAQFRRAADALAAIGVEATHFSLQTEPLAALKSASSVFVGGGNTYTLLARLRESSVLPALATRVRDGMPYIGTSAGSNVAGVNILATNDWNVVGANRFDAMNLVPWTINPHYRETDPAMAPGSETRDQRIGEYLSINTNPVLAIEEETAVQAEGGRARIVGRGRGKLFVRGEEPRWLGTGDELIFSPGS